MKDYGDAACFFGPYNIYICNRGSQTASKSVTEGHKQHLSQRWSGTDWIWIWMRDRNSITSNLLVKDISRWLKYFHLIVVNRIHDSLRPIILELNMRIIAPTGNVLGKARSNSDGQQFQKYQHKSSQTCLMWPPKGKLKIGSHKTGGR